MKKIAIKVDSLKKYYPVKRGLLYRVVGQIKAVDDVSFEIAQGQTMGLVGESGCGKTTLGRTVLRLLEPDSGRIFFQGQEITRLPSSQLRTLRAKMQIVFQDPFDCLDPRFTVSRIVSEGLEIFKSISKSELQEQVKQILDIVGLPADAINRYPHEFSGGQRQRIGIARAISLKPAFLVLDEPVSSLDVSIQQQIIHLLYQLQERLSLSYLFITHDLNLTREVSDHVAVMYLGKIVEQAETKQLFQRPEHPYTKMLLEAIPIADPMQRKKRSPLKGELASAVSLPSGCRFRTRCSYAIDVCVQQQPCLKEIGPGHFVACHIN